MNARYRFHRYVAGLLAATVPFAAAIELIRAMDGGVSAVSRVLGPVTLTVWALKVARSRKPNALPLVVAAMWFVGSLIVIEAVFDTEVTSVDFTTAFGLMMLFAVLAGNLTSSHRVLWAGGLAAYVAAWIVTIGVLDGTPVDAIATRAVIAVAGVIFTTALVSELYYQLLVATNAHNRATRLQEAVARCSEALLVHQDTFALYEAVRAVLEATDADYAYVDQTIEIDEEPAWEIVAEAFTGIGDASGWMVGKYSTVPLTYEALLAGHESVVRTRELRGTAREQYEQDNIVSEICVPIFVGGVFRGSIGFVEYTTEREWSNPEVQTLWRAADMIGAYWRRQDDADALRASNASKDKLLSSVSHEIRTPLTAIVGLSEEIASNPAGLGREELEELNGIIAVQSRELAELVEDLLVASRADFGNLSIRPEVVSLADQVDRVLQGVRESSPNRKTVVFSGGDVTAWADPLRVRQIIRNLVTNALKYGGDRVVITLREDVGVAAVAVVDDGAGVPEAESQLIFERYYRSVDTPTQPGSVGIGLAVSRQLAEMMGGSLSYLPGAAQHRFELALPSVGGPRDPDPVASPEFATPR
jgi:signal transduction histidine kinase